jgi:hypothetical protein
VTLTLVVGGRSTASGEMGAELAGTASTTMFTVDLFR